MNSQLKPIPELDNLADEQKDQLHAWLSDLGYQKTMEKLKAEWQIDITYNKLYRYYRRVLQKSDFDDILEDEIAMPDFLALQNGHPVPYDKAGIARIQKRAFDLAS